MFRNTDDWKKEMRRTRCKNWRLSVVNQNFMMSSLLPQNIVVPETVTDNQLINAAEHFRNRCCPTWVRIFIIQNIVIKIFIQKV